MSVPNEIYQSVHTTDGFTYTWAFTWAVTNENQVKVYLDGVLQSLSTYTASKNLVTVGGTITFTAGNLPTAGKTLLIQRESDLLQENSFGNNAALPPSTLIDMFDKLTIIAQQVSAQIGLAFRLPLSTVGVSTTLAAPVAGAILAWNAAGNAATQVAPVAAGRYLMDNGPGQLPSYEELAAGPQGPAGPPGQNGTGTGDVVGPATAVNRGIALFDGTTGKLIKTIASVGTSGHFLQSQGTSADPIFAALPSTGGQFGDSGTRQLPTSGAISGVYYHVGNWASTGNLTAEPGTRIYIVGTWTLTHVITVSNSGTGRSSSTYKSVGTYTSEGMVWGAGPGGGQFCGMPDTAAAHASGGGGGGFGGAGGNGGAASGGANGAVGGKGGPAYAKGFYKFGSDGGIGGGSTGSNPGGVGGSAGSAGGTLDVFATDTITISGSGAINADGGAGGAGTGGTYASGGGGAGSGGRVSLLSLVQVILSATLAVTCRGGQGGNASSASGGAGAGGSGGYIDAVSPTAPSVTGSVSVAAGAGGSTGSAAGAAGAGVFTSITATPNLLAGWL